MARNVVIVSGVRTPFDKFGGVMRDMSTVELGTIVVKEAINRAQIKPEEVDEFYLGINWPTSNRSIARQVAIKSGIPVQCNSLTVDRACCSSMAAIAMGYRAIALGEADIAVGGGAENMSKIPYFLEDLRWGKRLGDVLLKDILIVSCPLTGVPRAVQAGEGALKYGITREEQDKWALRSHQLYGKAFEEGKFKDEIIPVEIIQAKGEKIVVDRDQSYRPDTSYEKLSKLPTVYNSPTVTAGNAPGMNTGAAAVVLMSEEKAKNKGIKPLAKIISHAQASDEPHGITYIPAYAALKALKKVNMTIDQMDVIEINEAFAAMPLVSTKILGDNDPNKVEKIRAKTNVNGGAIAIGHPTGASAARLVMTVCYELRRRGGGYGLATICGGIGEGECIIVKVDE
jgi:acetyl-CoA C-acetyltransferase